MGEYKGYILEEGEVEPGKYGILIYDSEETWRSFSPVDTAWDETDAKRKIDEGKVLEATVTEKSGFLERLEAPPPKFEVGDEIEFTSMIKWLGRERGIPKLRPGLRGEVTDVHRGALGYTTYSIQLFPSAATPEGLKLVDVPETAYGITLIKKVG